MRRIYRHYETTLRPPVHIDSGEPTLAVRGWKVQLGRDQWPDIYTRDKETKKRRKARLGEVLGSRSWAHYRTDDGFLLSKGIRAHELFLPNADGHLEIREEWGVSGGLAHRTFGPGHIWCKAKMHQGEEWECRFKASDSPNEAVTRVKYHLGFNLRVDRRYFAMAELLGDTPQAWEAVGDWQDMAEELAAKSHPNRRRPPLPKFAVRVDSWGDPDFINSEFYIECEGLGRVGWAKAHRGEDGELVFTRLACWHEIYLTDWRPKVWRGK